MKGHEWHKKKVILFDLDGTLTDPGIGITNSVMYALKTFGIHVEDRCQLYKFIGPPLSQSFERFYGFSPEAAKAAVEAYRVYFGDRGIFENTVFEGIRELLEKLKNQEKVIVLATSKPEVYAMRILEHFDLAPYFDLVCGSLLNGERTDKGEVIGWAMKQLRTEKGIKNPEVSAVMIGDREHDMLGAAKNGLPALGVLFGYGSREELTAAGADGLMPTVSALHETLTGEVKGGVL